MFETQTVISRFSVIVMGSRVVACWVDTSEMFCQLFWVQQCFVCIWWIRCVWFCWFSTETKFYIWILLTEVFQFEHRPSYNSSLKVLKLWAKKVYKTAKPIWSLFFSFSIGSRDVLFLWNVSLSFLHSNFQFRCSLSDSPNSNGVFRPEDFFP